MSVSLQSYDLDAAPVKRTPFRDRLNAWFSSVFNGGTNPDTDGITQLLLGHVTEQAEMLDALTARVAMLELNAAKGRKAAGHVRLGGKAAGR
jgi:hypothetical protein